MLRCGLDLISVFFYLSKSGQLVDNFRILTLKTDHPHSNILAVVFSDGEELNRVEVLEDRELTFIEDFCVIGAVLHILYALSSLTIKTLKVDIHISPKGNGGSEVVQIHPILLRQC